GVRGGGGTAASRRAIRGVPRRTRGHAESRDVIARRMTHCDESGVRFQESQRLALLCRPANNHTIANPASDSIRSPRIEINSLDTLGLMATIRLIPKITMLTLNLPLIFIGCRKLQRTRADWSRDGQNAA